MYNKIELIEFDTTDSIVIINELFNHYIYSINNCKHKLKVYGYTNNLLLDTTINTIESFKPIFNTDFINSVCANSNINSRDLKGKSINYKRNSLLPTKDEKITCKNKLEKLYDIYNKILNIQLIFVIIKYLNEDKDNIKYFNLYCAALYSILDNILFTIFKIIKSIEDLNRDIYKYKYKYTIAIIKFLQNMKITNLKKIIITDVEVSDSVYTELSELTNLKMYSKKLPLLVLKVLNDDNILEYNLSAKISEIKTIVSNFSGSPATIDITDSIADYSIDYNKEFESIHILSDKIPSEIKEKIIAEIPEEIDEEIQEEIDYNSDNSDNSDDLDDSDKIK